MRAVNERRGSGEHEAGGPHDHRAEAPRAQLRCHRAAGYELPQGGAVLGVRVCEGGVLQLPPQGVDLGLERVEGGQGRCNRGREARGGLGDEPGYRVCLAEGGVERESGGHDRERLLAADEGVRGA